MRVPRLVAAVVGLLAYVLCACVTSENIRRGGVDTGAGGGSAGTGGGGGSAQPLPDAARAAMDAAAPDRAGSSADATREGPAPSCTHQLCDGFEGVAPGAAPDPATWQKVASTGTIEVVSGMAHAGSQSLHVISPSGSYETYLRERRTFPAAGNAFYGRLYFYLKETLPADFVHWTIVEGRGTSSNNRVRYGGINNMTFGHWYLFNIETQSSAGETGIDDDHSLTVPAGRWICLEWKFDGGASDAQLWADGVEHPQIHVGADVIKGAFAMPTFDSLYVGWGIYQAISKPYEVWIDDVAVDSQRIGCAL